jgi:thiamine biosynthesis protein ThiS
MEITVNGERRTVSEAISLVSLLNQMGLRPEATVVERNGAVVERSRCAEITLAEGDILELVRFVGGG